jgi:hypothetical protein
MGIRTYKEWPCAIGDSATYFVAAESGSAVHPTISKTPHLPPHIASKRLPTPKSGPWL